jgi:putative aminopeptidase FrvX
MAAVGVGQTSDEFHVTICAKDSGGPYHAGLTDRLVRLASAEGIPHRLDIYPHYGSDGEAYWRSGGDVRVALVGPGVDASHHYERTHMDALIASAQLIAAYLTS